MKAILLFCTLLFSFSSYAEPLSTIQGVDVVTGQNLEVHTARQKNVVLIFLSAKCPCSASHEGELKELSATHPEFSFIGVHANGNEDLSLTRTHFEDAKLHFPVIEDKQAQLANTLGALKTPHAFVLNSQGQIIYQGGVTDRSKASMAKTHFLKEVLEDLKNGKTPRHKEGRTLGCYIQRGDEQ